MERLARLEVMVADLIRIVGNTNSAVEELRDDVGQLKADAGELKADRGSEKFPFF